MSGNRDVVESLCRLKAERDQLREKEKKWKIERDKVKVGMREFSDAQLAERTKIKRQHEARIQDLLSTIEAEKENFGVKQAESIQFERKIQQQNHQIQSAIDDKRNLTRDIQRLKSTIAENEQDLEELYQLRQFTKSLEHQHQQLQAKAAEVDSANRKKENVSQKYIKAEADVRSLQEQVRKVNSELDQAKSKNARIKLEYDGIVKKERTNFENRNGAVIAEYEHQIDGLNAAIGDLNNDAKQLQSQLREISKSADDYQKKLSIAEEKLDVVERDYRQIELELDAVQRSQSSKSDNLEQERCRLEDEIEVLNANVDAKSSELVQLKSILTSTEDDRDDLVKQLNDAREEQIQLKRQLENRQKSELESVADHKVRLQEVKVENQRLVRDLESLNRQLDDKTEDMAELAANCEEKQREADDLQRRLRAVEDERRDQLSQITFTNNEQSREVDRLQGQLEVKNAELRRVIDQEKRVEARIESLQNDYDHLNTQMRDKDIEVENIRSQMTALESERDELLLRVSQQDVTKKTDGDSLKRAKQESEAARRELLTERETMKRDIDQLDRQVATLKSDYRRLESDNDQERNQVQTLRSQLLKVEDEKSYEKAKHAEMDTLAVKIRVLEQEKASLMEIIESLEDESSSKDNEIQKLNHELEILDRERQTFEKQVVEQKGRAEAFEAKFHVKSKRDIDDDLKIETLEDEIEDLEHRYTRDKQKFAQENQLLSAQNKDLQKKIRLKEDEILSIIDAEDERRDQILESDHRVDDLKKKLKSERCKRELLEKEFNHHQDRQLENMRAMKLEQATVMDNFKEKKKLTKEIDELSGQVLAEREKNNQFKHENKDLRIDQERNRQINHQQAKLIEMLQRQNEDLTPKKSRKKTKNLTPNYTPPPLYKDLERQIDLLRVENSKLKSKLYGSNTDLDKIPMKSGGKSRDGSPSKPPRTLVNKLNIRKSISPMTPFPSSFVGLCAVSSLPVYIGDQVVKRNGLVAHERFTNEFTILQSNSKRRKSRADTLSFSGNLLFLHNGEWSRVYANVEKEKLILAGEDFQEIIDLNANIALHGAVCFDHVKFMAEVDHEMCFGIETIPASFGSKYRPEMEYFCALNLSDKQNWYEVIKQVVTSPPTLPVNDHSKFDVQKVHQFQDKIPDVCCAAQVEGYTLIGSTDNLLASDWNKIVIASKTPVVVLETMDDLVFGIAHKERYPVFFYADGVKSLIRSNVQISLNKIVKESAHTIKPGRYQGKVALAAAFGSTVKVFQFSKHHPLDKEYEVFEVLRVKLESIPSCLAFSSSSLICGTDRIMEVEFHKQSVEPYLAESEVQKTHQEKPIDMFTLYDGGKERHLICGQHGGYLVDNCGRVVQRINWSSLPLAFKYAEPYLYVSHLFGIELVKIGIGKVSQPTILSSFRPRLLGCIQTGKLILLSRPYGEKRTSSASVKILTGTQEIEYDEAISGPSSLNSNIGLAYRPSRAYRFDSQQIADNTNSTGTFEYSVYR